MVHNIQGMKTSLLLISDSAECLNPVLEQPLRWHEWWRRRSGERKTGGGDEIGNYEKSWGISGMNYGEEDEWTRRL